MILKLQPTECYRCWFEYHVGVSFCRSFGNALGNCLGDVNYLRCISRAPKQVIIHTCIPVFVWSSLI